MKNLSNMLADAGHRSREEQERHEVQGRGSRLEKESRVVFDGSRSDGEVGTKVRWQLQNFGEERAQHV